MLIVADRTERRHGFELRYVTSVVGAYLQLVHLEVRGNGTIELGENVHPHSFELDISPDRQATIRVEGVVVDSPPEQLTLIHPGARHSVALQVTRSYSGFSLFVEQPLLAYGVGSERAYSSIEDVGRRMQTLFGVVSRSFPPAARGGGAVDALAIDLVQALVAEIRRKLIAAQIPEGIARLVLQLRRRYPDEHSLDSMAAVAGMSKYHLIRRFKVLFDVTPLQYLTNLRIERAVDLIRSGPKDNISQIAFAVGFNDISVFHRHFKRRHGMSPGAFRRHLAPAQEPGRGPESLVPTSRDDDRTVTC